MDALRLAFWRKPLELEERLGRVFLQPRVLLPVVMLDLQRLFHGFLRAWAVFSVAFSFMELSCLIPSAGSTYAYTYYALGELPALIAGFLLTLEYGVSSAGGARSWSDKLTQWMDSQFGVQGPSWMKPQDSLVDLYAGLLMATTTAIVLCGMQAGKVVVNVVTMTKITVVIGIIVIGLIHFDKEKISPFVPDQRIVEIHGQDQMAFGWPGVLVGTSASFYGYIGYDEVCCLAGEAINPARNIPRAVVGTIIGAATLSILATFALVGMQKYTEIDAEESYGNAFASIGLDWAASFVALGEVLTMPVTSFIGFLAQPRVQYAMAKDGLLPPVFADVDANDNPFRGTLLCGIGVTLLAVFVPFHVLWNFISLGILVAFNLTNSSLLLVRASNNKKPQESETKESSLKRSHGATIAGYFVSSFLAAFHWQKGVVATVPLSATTDASIFDSYMQTVGPFVAAFFTVVAVALMFALNGIKKEQTIPAEVAVAKAKAQSQTPMTIVVASKKQQDPSETGRVSNHHQSLSSNRDNTKNDLKTT
ncbi:unnamed protein product [Peronospora destructor]|uniref:Cationic amino acid transporter C-terminal domain-containing protein n=1 Tax=Peronospora destructor TaxID=86335 RepID=A0AAV0URV0_9STRA|nr:unnamed protein product [Peronospora destructor]